MFQLKHVAEAKPKAILFIENKKEAKIPKARSESPPIAEPVPESEKVVWMIRLKLKLSRKNLRICHRAHVTAQSFNGSVTYTSKLEKKTICVRKV
ncbi:hypothetical protein Hanom_Chr16g01478881 [Helianthus anomalus]